MTAPLLFEDASSVRRLEVMTRRVTLPENVQLADVVALSEWFGRKWPMIEPLKDVEGIEKLITLRMTSRSRELNKLGIDYKKVIEEIAAEEQFAKDNGVTLAQMVAASSPTTETPPADPSRGLRAVS